MVGSAEPVNGFLCLKTKKMYVLLHETVGSTEPTDGFLDPAMQETLVLLHETEGSEDPSNGFLCFKTKKMYVLLHETVGSTEPTDGFLDPAMQETLVLLHETEGSEDPSNGMLRPAQSATWPPALPCPTRPCSILLRRGMPCPAPVSLPCLVCLCIRPLVLNIVLNLGGVGVGGFLVLFSV